MRDFRINWAVILALIVLLAFTYFSFMGVLYSRFVGDDHILLKGGLYALAVILIVATCVVILCVSRATRWKEIGAAGQIVFALIILAVFGVSAIPFTNFLKAIESKDEIQAQIDKTKHVADSVDMAYNAYVDGRLAQYEEWLRSDSLGSRAANAGGSTTEEKITNLKASLEHHLKPMALDSCQTARKDWLSKIEGMSVWNIMLPQNIKILNASTKSWAANYSELSNISYDGETPELFKYNGIEENPLQDLGKLDGKITWKAVVAIAAALIAFFFMMLPYIVTEPFIGSKTDTKKDRRSSKTPDHVEVDYE